MPKSTNCRWGALASTIFMCNSAALAQSAAPEDELRKLIRISEDVQPLGDNAFGEQISLYNGATRFVQIDISSSGQGPLLQVSRTFELPDYRPDVLAQPYLSNELVDWSLDIPRLETLSAVYTLYPPSGKPQKKWSFLEEPNRCTGFTQAPDISLPSKPGFEDVQWPSQDWWLGYQLHIPGQAKQDVLYRDRGNAAVPGLRLPDGSPMAFPAATRQHWRVGCLPHAANDGGDAFLAVAPDGTRYTLARLMHKPYVPIGRAGGGGLERRLVKMLATRVEDRFGNALAYSYDSAGKLSAIEATDGRKVSFNYEPWTHGSGRYPSSDRLVSATLQPASRAARTWRYAYTVEALPRLASVTQPDGAAWTFDTSGIRSPASDPVINYLGCSASVNQGVASSSAVSMTAPSGLVGRFDFRTTVRGRGNVQYACLQDGALGETHLAFQNLYTAGSITQRSYSGAGIGTQTWQYAYSPPNESWDTQCGGCQSEVWTDVTDPSGNGTRTVFSNRADVSESRLKRTERYAGGFGGALVQRDTYDYAPPGNGPWPSKLGSTMQYRMNEAQAESLTPVTRHTSEIDGNRYTREVMEFDAFAQDVTVSRGNDIAGQVGKVERTEWLNDIAHWAIGLPRKMQNVSTGEMVWENTYDSMLSTLTGRYQFGHLAMSYRFDEGGRLTQYADGKGNATKLSQYKRGIPQTITFPDARIQSFQVDDFGQVTSFTNETQDTTSYSYTEMGRLRSVTPPADESTPWNSRVFDYVLVGGSERGIDGAHWRKSVAEGERVELTYYDALMRPILVDAHRSDGALRSSRRIDYDWQGKKTFESYPFDGAPALDAMGVGLITAYDALGRPVRTVQHSEQGDLVTGTEYLPGAGRRVTDPKGNRTTTWMQVFDDLSSSDPIRIDAPENVVQTIKRDIHGYPLTINQGGAGASLMKALTYDSHHRLCRFWEPESGSTVFSYDAADNVTWSASGLNFNGQGCGHDTVSMEDQIKRTYDNRNRLSIINHFGADLVTYSYNDVGNVTFASSANAFWRYTYNHRGLLTSEKMSFEGFHWAIAYGYDGNGALSWAEYPDGDVVSFVPDAFGRPTSVGDYARGASYFPGGGIRSFVTGNGGTFLAERNERRLLSNFTYGRAGIPFVSEDLSYDRNGNISSVSDLIGSGQRSKRMDYDGLDRLAMASAPSLWGTETYAYDTLNNLRSIVNAGGTRTYHYDSSNLLRSISDGSTGGHEFRYDLRGNLSAKDGTQAVFDSLDRLTSIVGKVSYRYDAFGRRVKKVSPEGTTYYAYGSAGKLLWEFDNESRHGSAYMYLGNKLIAKATEHVDILKPKQVKTKLSIVGVPRLTADGKFIEATIAISNLGTRPLVKNGDYPVRLGYHLVDQTGKQTDAEAPVALPEDVPVDGHIQMLMRVASTAVLGKGQTVRFSLVQPGVAWFQDWPANETADIGPYSACLNAGDGRLCNNVTGLIRSQVDVVLTTSGNPRFVDDHDHDHARVRVTANIMNRGNVTLSPVGPLPVKAIAEFEGAEGHQGLIREFDVPEIPPGESGKIEFDVESDRLVETGDAVRVELTQGSRRFRELGATPLSAGPYLTPIVPAFVAEENYTVNWIGVDGAENYVLYEWGLGGGRYEVANTKNTSWVQPLPVQGPLSYQLRTCHETGCLPDGKRVNVVVGVPWAPRIKEVLGAPIGPLRLNWSASERVKRVIVFMQRDGAGWQKIYEDNGSSLDVATPLAGSYVFKMQACDHIGCSDFAFSKPVVIVKAPTMAPAIHGGGLSNNGSYTVSWTPVPSEVYSLTESVNGGAGIEVQRGAATSWGTHDRGDGVYAYQVKACNVAGCGPASTAVVVTVALVPPTPGNVQADYRTVNPKRETLSLSWAPTRLVGYYQVFDISTQQMFAPHVPAGTHSILLESGEPPLESHAYQVRACNANGCSDWGRP